LDSSERILEILGFCSLPPAADERITDF